MPQQPYERYVRQRVGCDLTIWAPHCRASCMPVGNRLRIQSTAEMVVRWSVNDVDAFESVSRDTGIGVWLADLDTERVPVGGVIRFAIVPRVGGGWSEIHEVRIVA
jgi:hypothetical protein